MKRLGILWRVVRWLWRVVRVGIGLLILTYILTYSTYPVGKGWNKVALIIADVHFDYVGWEVEAIGVKVEQALFGVSPFMEEAARAQFVRDYSADLLAVQQLEAQIDAVYADPDVDDPDAATAEQRAERDARRADLRSRQPLYESILEGQIAAVLQTLGFGFAGQIMPPVSAHFTQTPVLLVISPRDSIRMDIYFNLDPIPVDKRAEIEARVEQTMGMSALIVPIGGIALYPAMIQETSSIVWALETVAHEWLHHYLFAFPLGLDYDFTGEARIINETAATLFGQQVARLALARYYPDLLPPEVVINDAVPQETPEPPSQPPRNLLVPPPFDFGLEMHQTRKQVDWLLSKGEVDEAELYMEERRRFFAANGYGIRRINQAFFAFYGGYQAGGTAGAGGSDPIGPAVRDILRLSPDLHSFVILLREITSRDALINLRDSLLAAPPED